MGVLGEAGVFTGKGIPFYAVFAGNNHMAYVRLKGIQGLVYVPDSPEEMKKHNCPDCFCCQWCSDSRCHACLKQAGCRKAGKTCRNTNQKPL